MTLVEQGASPVRSRPRIDTAIGWVAAAIGAFLAARPLLVHFVFRPHDDLLGRHSTLQLFVGLLLAGVGSWLAGRTKPRSALIAACVGTWMVASVFAVAAIDAIAYSGLRNSDIWARAFTSRDFLVPLSVALVAGLAACVIEQRLGAGRLDLLRVVRSLVATGLLVMCGAWLLDAGFIAAVGRSGSEVVRHTLVVAVASGLIGAAVTAFGPAPRTRRLLFGAGLVAAGAAAAAIRYMWEYYGRLDYRLQSVFDRSDGRLNGAQLMLVLDVVAVIAVILAVVCVLRSLSPDEPADGPELLDPAELR